MLETSTLKCTIYRRSCDYFTLLKISTFASKKEFKTYVYPTCLPKM